MGKWIPQVNGFHSFIITLRFVSCEILEFCTAFVFCIPFREMVRHQLTNYPAIYQDNLKSYGASLCRQTARYNERSWLWFLCIHHDIALCWTVSENDVLGDFQLAKRGRGKGVTDCFSMKEALCPAC